MDTKKLICICCPIGCELQVNKTENGVEVTGNKCPRGKKYALSEIEAPKRYVTSTVKIEGWMYPVISVKTKEPIPKENIFEVMNVLSDVTIKAPVHVGEIVVKNILNLGVDIIATRNTD
ncbi:MAG: DUF1667 domain-containing protein [Pseudomonadota bacterium]|nr:DUF1667 domain-containing protein [Gammaproteobacteria bacterium]MBU1558540.1 DUF1667 domain-containing protein [Gammaproteobacteria bacterium]MBU1629031.1 DUF1667 domain-containing protein [Gammaproteobacteria bacterium]MBU1927043.1 DUF1667 domain-containing protein [Gammaproteobacteria bacterium]MBU2546677.1 DUF1667 domain-containing protein [Gammaproteobacteria bacterium]